MTAPAPSATASVHALSPAQERRLVDHLEQRFLDITRAFKKRSQPDATTLPTLSAYLKAIRSVLSVILQIPPVDPSASLRTVFLLRLTGDVLSAVPGYALYVETLPELLQTLEELDIGWETVLRSQSWDVNNHEGVDLPPDIEPGRTPTTTERTRLRSVIIGGSDKLEEWMEQLDTAGEDFTLALERLGVQKGFDELFSRTLSELGSLEGSATMNHPNGMVGTC